MKLPKVAAVALIAAAIVAPTSALACLPTEQTYAAHVAMVKAAQDARQTQHALHRHVGSRR
jgi:hypothetical protein